jgi:dihydroorotate dehydrogenase
VSANRSAAAVLARVALPALLRLPPESAHSLGLLGLRFLRSFWPAPARTKGLEVNTLGLRFVHPVGLAAGFDKNGDYLDALGAVGFAHIEVGTVTPRPQPGNAKPRLFRLRRAQALINRMGFNNRGADHVAQRLRSTSYRGVRGVSIGKNADTPLERAAGDYIHCLVRLYDVADYFAVNLSSPNTARLRELQEPGTEFRDDVLDCARASTDRRADMTTPIAAARQGSRRISTRRNRRSLPGVAPA